MKLKIKNIWVEALRSGKFNQTKNHLHNRHGFCCLGVLCKLAIEAGVDVVLTKGNEISVPVAPDEVIKLGVVFYDGAGAFLPPAVQRWAGMKTNEGSLSIDPESEFLSVSDMNDNDKNFEEIADVIDKDYKDL